MLRPKGVWFDNKAVIYSESKVGDYQLLKLIYSDHFFFYQHHTGGMII